MAFNTSTILNKKNMNVHKNMNLRYIALWIKHPVYSGIAEEVGYAFNSETRFVCNYLSKCIRKKKILMQGFNMISVNLVKGISPSIRLSNVDKCLTISVAVEDSLLDSLGKMRSVEERAELFLRLLEEAYTFAKDYLSHCMETLMECHDQFRQANYLNEWTFWKKTVPDAKLRIQAYLTNQNFKLLFEVFNRKSGDLMMSHTIFQTLPDELCFDYKFRKVLFDEEQKKVIILDHVGKHRFVIGIENIHNNEIKVEYLYEDDEYDKRLSKDES